MPLIIVRNDITKMPVDAIVNAAKESLLGGGWRLLCGISYFIHYTMGAHKNEKIFYFFNKGTNPFRPMV